MPDATGDPNQATLAVSHLSVRFGGNEVLRDVSCTVEAGKITALIGPNGAGKTTLLNAISGFVQPQGGSIEFAGHSLTGKPPWRIASLGIGRTFQSGHVFKSMTVRENLMGSYGLANPLVALREFVAAPRGRAERRAAEAAAEEMAEKLGLADVLDEPASLLPVGAQKIVDVGRALAARPRVLLADEPAAGLSPSERQTMACILSEVAASGQAVLLVEHDMRFVMSLSDVVYVLNFGNVIACGSPEDIQQDEQVIAAYLGEALPT